MSILNRDVVVVIKFVTSCITAGFLIFFISALTGEDLFKNQQSIEELVYEPAAREALQRGPRDWPPGSIEDAAGEPHDSAALLVDGDQQPGIATFPELGDHPPESIPRGC